MLRALNQSHIYILPSIFHSGKFRQLNPLASVSLSGENRDLYYRDIKELIR